MVKRLRAAAVRVGLAGGCLGLVAVATTAGTSHASAAPTKYYLSLGDSYSVGYQPGMGATSGYTAVVAAKEKMQLVNYGCGGATSGSLLSFNGVCGGNATDDPEGYAPPAATDAGTIPSGDTQITAAEAFIAAHPGQIGLITVSIGGNDVTPCINAAPGNPVNGQTDAIDCVVAGIAAIKTNVVTAVDELSAAAPGVPIVGLTYPDVLLGLWVYPTYPPSASNESLAEESVTAFESFINPDLKAAYTGVAGGKFVDITADTGAYKFSATKLGNYQGDKVPKAVLEVCKYTWYCSQGNIHANSKGYALIGKEIVKALK